MKLKIFMLLYFIVLTQFGIGYTQQPTNSGYISGHVYAIIENEKIPINYAMINIESKNYGAMSDSTGFFKISNIENGDYSLHVKVLGYNSKDTSITVNNKNLENIVINFYTNCEISKRLALIDLKSKVPKLWIYTGDAIEIFTEDEPFFKKYGVNYASLGDEAPLYECTLSYNKTIFNFLDSKFGKVWRKDVRKDVFGLNYEITKKQTPNKSIK